MGSASQRLPDVVGERADVEAGRGGHAQAEEAAVFDVRCSMTDVRCTQYVEPVHRDWHRLQLDRLIPARLLVRRNACDLLGRERWRRLQEWTAKFREHRFEFGIHRISAIGYRISNALGQ